MLLVCISKCFLFKNKLVVLSLLGLIWLHASLEVWILLHLKVLLKCKRLVWLAEFFFEEWALEVVSKYLRV